MPNKTTTIQVTIETYKKLYSVKTLIQKIVRKKIDFDVTIAILLSTKSLEEQLIDMQLEEVSIKTLEKQELKDTEA